MSVRILSAQAKVASVVIAYVVGGVITLVIALIAGGATGAITGIVLLVAMVVFFTRVFRGESEDVVRPRRWWRLTERPRAGCVLAVLFAADTVFLAATAGNYGNGALNVIAIVVNAVIALAFFGSSMRLLAAGREAAMKS